MLRSHVYCVHRKERRGKHTYRVFGRQVIKAGMEPGNETKRNEIRTGLCALHMLTSKPTTMSSSVYIRFFFVGIGYGNVCWHKSRERVCRRLFWTEPSCSRIIISRLVDILYKQNA